MVPKALFELIAAVGEGVPNDDRQGPHLGRTVQPPPRETADLVEPDAGGARKAPSGVPYLSDWACAANGAWARLVIESIFGVDARLTGPLRAAPRIAAFDPEAVLQAEEEGKAFACGRGAVAAVLWAACGLGADQVKIVNYATSGDVTGDYSTVVGYGAAAIYQN